MQGKKNQWGKERRQKRKKKYFPPNLYGTWGKNIILQKKGRRGEEYDFWGKYIVFTLIEPTARPTLGCKSS